jgi:hypothetical protein
LWLSGLFQSVAIKHKLSYPLRRIRSSIAIRTLDVIVGHLPRRALNLTIEWAIEHRQELMEDWNLCQAGQQPKKIQPLE